MPTAQNTKTIMRKQKIRAADAKEVAVGNTAEKTFRHLNLSSGYPHRGCCQFARTPDSAVTNAWSFSARRAAGSALSPRSTPPARTSATCVRSFALDGLPRATYRLLYTIHVRSPQKAFTGHEEFISRRCALTPLGGRSAHRAISTSLNSASRFISSDSRKGIS